MAITAVVAVVAVVVANGTAAAATGDVCAPEPPGQPEPAESPPDLHTQALPSPPPPAEEPSMNKLLTLVVCMTVLTWAAVLAASLVRSRGWTPEGMKVAMGNREGMPEASGLAGRAERAARNTLENLPLFVALALVAQAAGAVTPRVVLGAEIFFWARVVYVPVYWAGIAGVRTGIWGVSIAGLAMMVSGLL
jgi:uncharacterized MAPEG superfamily protein